MQVRGWGFKKRGNALKLSDVLASCSDVTAIAISEIKDQLISLEKGII